MISHHPQGWLSDHKHKDHYKMPWIGEVIEPNYLGDRLLEKLKNGGNWSLESDWNERPTSHKHQSKNGSNDVVRLWNRLLPRLINTLVNRQAQNCIVVGVHGCAPASISYHQTSEIEHLLMKLGKLQIYTGPFVGHVLPCPPNKDSQHHFLSDKAAHLMRAWAGCFRSVPAWGWKSYAPESGKHLRYVLHRRL